jgi:hypothetical protein
MFLAQQEAYTQVEEVEIRRQVQLLDEMTQIVGGL